MPIRKKKWKDSMNGNVIKNYSSMLLCLMCILFLFPALADCRQESAQADTVIKTPGTLEELLELARKCPAEVGFYGRNFRSGNEVEYRPDQGACLASIVKIFTLLEICRQVENSDIDWETPITLEYEKGRKDKTDIASAVGKMIGQSDNAATDALTALAGYKKVNSLAKELNITGLSDQILPEPGVLGKVLDRRVYGKRVLDAGSYPPQHGSARGIVRYFELLAQGKLINEKISARVRDVFDRHPKPFAPSRPVNFYSGGKGGSLGWGRYVKGKLKQYDMAGWGILLSSRETKAAFCVWFEWFPEKTEEDRRTQWRRAISNGIVNLLLKGEKEPALSAEIPPYVKVLAVAEKQAVQGAWSQLLKDLKAVDNVVKKYDESPFVDAVAKAKIQGTAALNMEVIPVLLCKGSPRTAHYTWRWCSPRGDYGGAEVIFGPGIWGWLPEVKLDEAGQWRFEVACNGIKILDQKITVRK